METGEMAEEAVDAGGPTLDPLEVVSVSLARGRLHASAHAVDALLSWATSAVASGLTLVPEAADREALADLVAWMRDASTAPAPPRVPAVVAPNEVTIGLRPDGVAALRAVRERHPLPWRLDAGGRELVDARGRLVLVVDGREPTRGLVLGLAMAAVEEAARKGAR